MYWSSGIHKLKKSTLDIRASLYILHNVVVLVVEVVVAATVT